MPQHAVTGLPPAYRKVARAEFQVAVSYPAISRWYQAALRSCSLPVYGTMPLQQHGGPRFAALDASTAHGLSQLTVVFRPLSSNVTAVLYTAQTLDLPARPASSFLNGPFTRVAVDFVSSGAMPHSNYRYRFSINWTPTIQRLVKSINAPTNIWVALGGVGTPVSSQSATLSFLRPDGGARKVFVGGVLERLIVGRSRPLDDRNGRVLRFVAHIVHRRCQVPGAC